MKFTTKDLQSKLLDTLNNGSIAERNSVARVGAVMIATKQLELNHAGSLTQPVVLIEDARA
jgi:hypothetical protein